MDALGLITAVVVTAAGATDNAISIVLIDKAVEYTPTVNRTYVDAGSRTTWLWQCVDAPHSVGAAGEVEPTDAGRLGGAG